MNFLQKLKQRNKKSGSLVSVGIDPVMENLPEKFQEMTDPFFEFGKWIIDETHEYTLAYKPNSAFYESQGSSGIESLKKTCDYLKKTYSDIPIIIDAKRGDIGHTNAQYASFIFDYLKADAVTLQPYLGSEALSEFFKYDQKGLIILCRTSNPGAGEFQDLLVESNSGKKIPLWQKIAQEVSTTWANKTKANLLLVVGATYPEELKTIRILAPNTTFLIPGIGFQGGELEKTLSYGMDSNKFGVIINSSRGIIYSDSPQNEIRKLIDTINSLVLK